MCNTFEMNDTNDTVGLTKMRRITEVLKIRETSEGIGSRVRRCIGNGTIRCLPPFVMCESFTVNHIGYPTRPSRGGHKLQYIISGCLEVQFSHLEKIYIYSGDILSDMAGKGVMRSAKAYDPEHNRSNTREWPLKTQIPHKNDPFNMHTTTENDELQQLDSEPQLTGTTNAAPEDDNLVRGYYGINDPEHTHISNDVTNNEVNDNGDRLSTFFPINKFAKHTKRNHAYGISVLFDIPEPLKRIDSIQISVKSAEIATIEHFEGVKIKVLSGSMFGYKCPEALESLPVTMIDCTVDQSTCFELPTECDLNSFLLILDGTATIQDKIVHKNDYVEFKMSANPDEGNTADEADTVIRISVPHEVPGCRFIYCTGKPLNQPIYRQGPFIDVSMDWIHQAFEDYTEKKNGFEEQKAQRPLDPIEPAPPVPTLDRTHDPKVQLEQPAPDSSKTWVAENTEIPIENEPLEERKDSCESAASTESAMSTVSGSSTESATSAESNASEGFEDGALGAGEPGKPDANRKQPSRAA